MRTVHKIDVLKIDGESVKYGVNGPLENMTFAVVSHDVDTISIVAGGKEYAILFYELEEVYLALKSDREKV